MKKLSLAEFKDFCSKVPVERYMFSSEVQLDDNAINHDVTFVQSYKIMSVFLSPDALCFANDSDSQMIFECAKYVIIPDRITSRTINFKIVCGNAHSDCCDTTYVFVMVLQT